jgi:EAL domain-containing protein (putative c-di-GMP-specific phosphodiesterase class I)
MLADFQPDIIKIDMALTRNIHSDKVRRSIARAIISLCNDLQITVIAEGVETVDEAATLRNLGVALFQGYLFAKPSMERLPMVSLDALRAVRAKHESAVGKRRIAGVGRWDAKGRAAKGAR